MNRATPGTGWARNPDGSLGYTWNPITGCLNHTDGLCRGGGFPCYAYRLAHGRLKQRYLANKNLAPGAKGGVSTLTIDDRTVIEREGDYADPFYPRFWEERLDIKRKYEYGDCRNRIERRGVFLCDMSDLFGIGIPIEWQQKVFQMIRENPDDRFYVLTKQPQNLLRWSPFPDNCYVGVTATNESSFLNATNFLYNLEAEVKFISVEPLLSWDTSKYVYPFRDSVHIDDINWLIIGACTGTYEEMTTLCLRYPELTLISSPDCLNRKLWTAQPKIEDLREIVDAADRARIQVFLRDNLHPLLSKQTATRFHRAYPDYCELRQEMPQKEA